MNTVTVTHGWEAGHRLPHIPGKCQSLHGHSWRVEVEVDGEFEDGMVIEFGALKQTLRAWIDSRLDHGLILGHRDELVPLLVPYGKVFVIGGTDTDDEDAQDLDWPTVENTAVLLARVTQRLLNVIDPRCSVIRVTVHETPVNAATWSLT